ncbi:MAG: extracellular solute-binding protein [Candidatus Rokubacteria bacterium]|nr:extracellular solute-binding protein [Candidatus Rokubacteria bacterium]
MDRREFLRQGALASAAVTLGATAGPRIARAQGKTGTVRVWGEPGPYAGVAVEGMNEWAKANAPGLKFTIETLSWTDVYPKLMTDLAAGRPASCISVESPIAFQLMAEGLLAPVDDVIDKIGRHRMIPGAKWEYWGAWKGKQYVVPAHHQSHLLVVRTDALGDAGVTKSPEQWNWNDLLAAAKAVKEKTKLFGFCIALGRTIATDYYLSGLLHSAGARMFDVRNNFAVAFDSPASIETFEFVSELYPYMPPGALGYTFLDVVDSMATGHRGLPARRASPDGQAAQLERLPGLGDPEGQQPLRRRGQGGARVLPDAQGLAAPLRPLARAERLAGVPGRRPGSAADDASLLQDEAADDLRVLCGGAQACEQLRQRAPRGHQPVGGHRPRPEHPGPGDPEGVDRQVVLKERCEVGGGRAGAGPSRAHPAPDLRTIGL